MLMSLRIENFAIIEFTQVDFAKGFNVLTGETGAGKSILMEALGLILGDRSQKNMIRHGCEKSEIEAVFSTSNKKINQILTENGFEEEEVLIIQKTLYLDRPTISRINGKSVSNSLLSKITSYLVDSTHQQENQNLLNSRSQLKIIDKFAGKEQEKLLIELNELVKEYREILSFIQKEAVDEQSRLREKDLINYQLDEIKEARLKGEEDLQLENKFKKIKSFSNIKNSFSFLLSIVEDENGLRDLIEKFSSELSRIEGYDQEYESIFNRVEGLKYEWFDIFTEIRGLNEGLDFDEEELIYIENRLDLINRLKRKYGSSISHIMDTQREMEARLTFLEDFEKQMDKKNKELQSLLNRANNISEALRKNRIEVAFTLEKKIMQELKDLNIPHGRFSIHFEDVELTNKGMDKVTYYISTNKGEELKPFSHVASGGEMSRVLLAFKSIMAEMEETSTLIFDEIDAGMSGKTAKIVADKMRKIAKKSQLIVISHLPQVVAVADEQYQIIKEVKDNRTYSNIRQLSYEERIDYLATMISGTDHTIAKVTAKSMLEESR